MGGCKDVAMPEPSSRRGLTRGELIVLIVGVPIVLVAIVTAKPLVTSILNKILHLDPAMVYVTVGLLVFAEAALFFGFIAPGETAVILGGVAASGGRVNVVALCAVVVIAAIVGDSVGYAVGSLWGERVLRLRILEHRQGGIHTALGLLRRRGAIAVIIGRFTAFLRAVMPGLAGLSGLRYRTFLWANAAGGIVWGVGYVLLGYLLGSAYHRAEKYAGWVSTGLLALVVLIAVGLFVRGRVRKRSPEEDFEEEPPDEAAAIAEDLAAAREALREEDRRAP
jgi:membrane protein DedA with SNARE-associated domain